MVALLAATAALSLLFRFSNGPSSLGLPPTPPASRAFAPAHPTDNPTAVATLAPPESARAQTLSRFAYAHGWSGPMPEQMPAFRAWTQRYLATPSPT